MNSNAVANANDTYNKDNSSQYINDLLSEDEDAENVDGEKANIKGDPL